MFLLKIFTLKTISPHIFSKCITESLDQHSTVYTQTLKAGKHLCETMKDSECYSRLQSEFQAIDEAWQRTTSLLRERKDMLYTTVEVTCLCLIFSIFMLYLNHQLFKSVRVKSISESHCFD